MSNMCIPFQQSEYGSQHQNWYGWKRLNAALEPKIDETIREYGYEEDDDWDDEEAQDNNENI